NTGAQKSQTVFYPFGATRSSTGTLGTDKKFTGQRLDDTGLYFYNARYYDAEIGRFVSPDTIIPDWKNPQAWNHYSYALNNPLKYTDSTGHFVDWIPDIVAISLDILELVRHPSQENLNALRLDAWLALLPGVPAVAGFTTRAAKATRMLWRATATSKAVTRELSTFEHAAEYGVKTYGEMSKATAGTGLEAHHLVERRLAPAVGIKNSNDIPSIALTDAENQFFTNRWRDRIGYILDHTNLKTSNVTKEDVWAAAQKVYEEFPEIQKIVYDFLFQ
ncbi:MAG: hypothetical protein HY665_03235, partial [Chloroflexi bacterium]|nr:hypothetical protein [Chloroflexota bacterium]